MAQMRCYFRQYVMTRSIVGISCKIHLEAIIYLIFKAVYT